jgi:hypothetical protein
MDGYPFPLAVSYHSSLEIFEPRVEAIRLSLCPQTRYVSNVRTSAVAQGMLPKE